MAARRSLHAGGSYGRVQAVIIYGLRNFGDFDAWCCVKGIDPLELPAYRFFNLAFWYLQDGKTLEQLEELEKELADTDKDPHPLHDLKYQSAVTSKYKAVRRQAVEVPVEEQKRYVPSWWRGEHENAKIARKMMTALPKA